MVDRSRREGMEDVDTGGVYDGRAVRRISWGAVFAGAVVAVMAQALLSLLGIGVGGGSIEAGGAGPRDLGVGAGIWWLITGIVSMFIGGLVAGRLAAPEGRHDGALHGLVVWALGSLLLLFSIATAVGQLLGGALPMMQGAGAGASPAAVQEAAEKASQGALWAFVFFSVTSIAASIGGLIGTPRRRETTIPRATARRRREER